VNRQLLFQTLFSSLICFSHFPRAAFAQPPYFKHPQPVVIEGLPTGHGRTPLSTEEPFVSRDGRFLFFNTHKLENNKDLHYAEMLKGTWYYRGEIGPDINTKKKVEGNPSMDSSYNFYYVHSGSKHMIHVGVFDPASGVLVNVREFDAVPAKDVRLFGQKLSGNMGVEVSSGGRAVFFSRATWDLNGISLGIIIGSDLLLVERRNGRYVYDESYARSIFRNINTDEIEYAASISNSGLELFYTSLRRADFGPGKVARSRIMRATRRSVDHPFDRPEPILAIGNQHFVEGPAITPDGRTLYYHKLKGRKFRLYKVTR